jgi:hypothetical protein
VARRRLVSQVEPVLPEALSPLELVLAWEPVRVLESGPERGLEREPVPGLVRRP